MSLFEIYNKKKVSIVSAERRKKSWLLNEMLDTGFKRVAVYMSIKWRRMTKQWNAVDCKWCS